MVLFPVAGAGLVDNKAHDRHDEQTKEGRNAEWELQERRIRKGGLYGEGQQRQIDPH